MATVHFRNAKVLAGGVDISASLNELSVDYSAELLDETCFGDDTRINKGGLYNASMSLSGLCEFGALGIHDLAFANHGSAGEGIVVSVFANGITEGTQTDKGFAMLGVIEDLTIGGAVGTLLPISFTVQSRGLTP